MRKFKKREKERIHHLNELVNDAVVLFNESVLELKRYREEAQELLDYIELHGTFPLNERDYIDYSHLFSELKRIDAHMMTVQDEAAAMEREFTQFSRQYSRLIHHLEKSGEDGMSKIFAQMEELALDLHIHAYNTKVDTDLRYSLFYDFKLKMRAILFN